MPSETCPKCGAEYYKHLAPDFIVWRCGSRQSEGSGEFIQLDPCRIRELTASLAARDKVIAELVEAIEKVHGWMKRSQHTVANGPYDTGYLNAMSNVECELEVATRLALASARAVSRQSQEEA